MKHYLMIAHIDYEQHRAVMHGTDKYVLDAIAGYLNSKIKEDSDSDFINSWQIEEATQKEYDFFNIHVDEYIIEEIRSLDQ